MQHNKGTEIMEIAKNATLSDKNTIPHNKNRKLEKLIMNKPPQKPFLLFPNDRFRRFSFIKSLICNLNIILLMRKAERASITTKKKNVCKTLFVISNRWVSVP